MNSDYSNREIDTMMKDIHQKLDVIIDQTTRTNGRVLALEKWRWIITGALIAVGALSIPSLSILAKAFIGI